MFGLSKKEKEEAERLRIQQRVQERIRARSRVAVDTFAEEDTLEEAPLEEDFTETFAFSATDRMYAEELEEELEYAEFDRTYGPWDEEEIDTSRGYLDFGSMKVKMTNGLNMRLDVEQQSQQMVAVTLTKGRGSLQIQAFAAPKSSGIWSEISAEIADSVRQQGGNVEYSNGPLGRQIISKLPAKTADGRKGFRVARFVGVDGPRWFLRGVFSGDAALKPIAAAEMEEIFRSIVVIRGDDPRPPRDLLPMSVPESVLEAQKNKQENVANTPVTTVNKPVTTATAPVTTVNKPVARKRSRTPRRGPEITEIG